METDHRPDNTPDDAPTGTPDNPTPDNPEASAHESNNRWQTSRQTAGGRPRLAARYRKPAPPEAGFGRNALERT